ncbi:hypothetical protein U9M48_012459 [Paspalum notatum var. saurae]|uniref:Uncharacterized protein n=1 Tax=Paspalum notatum var. saurae TaxID=547442 RepID=A0AAQ3SXL8_PASNO
MIEPLHRCTKRAADAEYIRRVFNMFARLFSAYKVEGECNLNNIVYKQYVEKLNRVLLRQLSMAKVITEHLSVEEAADKSTSTCASLNQKLCPFQALPRGAKAAAVAPSPLRFQPLLASVWMLPWAKANGNPTAQALIISTGMYRVYLLFQFHTDSFRSLLAGYDPHLLLQAWPASSPLTRSHVTCDAPFLGEYPRAPQEHLLPGHQSSPPGLLPALISTPHNASKVLFLEGFQIRVSLEEVPTTAVEEITWI